MQYSVCGVSTVPVLPAAFYTIEFEAAATRFWPLTSLAHSGQAPQGSNVNHTDSESMNNGIGVSQCFQKEWLAFPGSSVISSGSPVFFRIDSLRLK